MKRNLLYAALIMLIVLAGVNLRCSAQFHVKVTCNPEHNGMANPEWMNNYVVVYTLDNWKHQETIKDQATYRGFRDDGTDFYISLYEVISFREVREAIAYAKRFSSPARVGLLEASAYAKHLKMSEQWRLENVKHPIQGGAPKPGSCSEKTIY